LNKEEVKIKDFSERTKQIFKNTFNQPIKISADTKLAMNGITAVIQKVNSLKQANSSMGTVNFSLGDAFRGIDNNFKNVEDLRNNVRSLYGEMGKVSVATNGLDIINAFTVKVAKADNTIDKFKYKLNGDTNQYELITSNSIDNQIKELEKLEKKLLGIESNFQTLKYKPNTKQGDIDSTLSTISDLKTTNQPMDASVIAQITSEVNKLGKSYDNISKQDLAEGQRRLTFYDTYITKQKELNSLQLKQLNKKVTDGEKEGLQGKVAELNKELATMRNNPNKYYKKEVSVDDNYKNLMSQYNTQFKIKQSHLEESQIIENKNNLYKELNNLQNEEFTIKQKMVNSNTETNQLLQSNLNIIKQQQAQVGKNIVDNKVQDNAKINEYLTTRQKLTTNLNVSETAYNQKQTQYQTQISNFQGEMANKIKNLQLQYRELVLQESINKLNVLMDELPKKGIKNSQQLQNEFKKIKNEMGSMEATPKQNTAAQFKNSMSGFGTEFKNAFSRLSMYLGANQILRLGTMAIKNSIKDIINIDTEMTNLKKVTDETSDSYDRFSIKAHQIGVQLGKQSSEVIKATTAWAKTGQSMENATELSKATLLGSNVGDVDVDTMQKYLIAPLKAWKMEAKDAINVVDVLNNVSNKHAINVEELGQAYSKSASVMAMANNTLGETTALITAAQAQTQLGGDVIGTALNKTDALKV